MSAYVYMLTVILLSVFVIIYEISYKTDISMMTRRSTKAFHAMGNASISIMDWFTRITPKQISKYMVYL